MRLSGGYKMKLLKLTALITAIIITATVISSCTSKNTQADTTADVTAAEGDSTSPAEDVSSVNLISAASYVLIDGEQLPSSSLEKENCAFSGKAGRCAELYYNEPITFNTVVLKEGSAGVITSFSIEAEQDGDYVLIYTQDEMGAYRYCAFPAVTTKAVRIRVTSCADDADFSVTGAEAYNVSNQDNSAFKSFAYITAVNACSGSFDAESLLHVTDVILFGLVSFDSEGNVFYNDISVGDTVYSGSACVDRALEAVRAAFSANGYTPRLHINILGPDPSGEFSDWDAQMDAKGELHLTAMDQNGDRLIEGINGVLGSYGFDGVCFDYEFPLKTKYTNAFSDFLIKLNESIGEKDIGAALASWCCSLKKKAVEVIDNVLVMSYDSFDSRGNHAPFACAVNDVKKFNDAGYRNEQLILGIPYYARPADKGSFWYDYSIEAASLGKFGNRATGAAPTGSDSCTERWYNGSQMTYDKTAYAMSLGLKGVMVWHLSCDLPYSDELSLTRAIAQAKSDRTAS